MIEWLHLAALLLYGVGAAITGVSFARGGRRLPGGAVIAVPMVMALRLIRLEQGVTFLPESYVKLYVNNGELVVLSIRDMPPLMSEPVLIAHKSRQPDTIHQEFVRILKEQLQHLIM